MARVFVQRVIVEYMSDDRLFTVEFDPNKVGSIFFNKDDVRRAQKAQTEPVPQEAPEGVAIVPLKGGLTLASQGDLAEMGVKSEAESKEPEQPATLSGPELWWHTNACTFFHPNEAPA